VYTIRHVMRQSSNVYMETRMFKQHQDIPILLRHILRLLQHSSEWHNILLPILGIQKKMFGCLLPTEPCRQMRAFFEHGVHIGNSDAPPQQHDIQVYHTTYTISQPNADHLYTYSTICKLDKIMPMLSKPGHVHSNELRCY